MHTARWLLPTAQGPLTRLLQPYFIIADHISRSFEDDERLEIHRAGALLRDLVQLLEAYKNACATDAQDNRRTLSDAILQGLSADRGLLLTRLDVLGPATMIEEVFIEREDGRAAYTSYGSSHLQILSKYRELIAGLAAQLREDASHVDPTRRQTLDGARVGGASTSQRGTRTLRTFDGMGRKYLQPTDDRPRRARKPRRCAECIWPPQRANVRHSGRSRQGFRPWYPSRNIA